MSTQDSEDPTRQRDARTWLKGLLLPHNSCDVEDAAGTRAAVSEAQYPMQRISRKRPASTWSPELPQRAAEAQDPAARMMFNDGIGLVISCPALPGEPSKINSCLACQREQLRAQGSSGFRGRPPRHTCGHQETKGASQKLKGLTMVPETSKHATSTPEDITPETITVAEETSAPETSTPEDAASVADIAVSTTNDIDDPNVVTPMAERRHAHLPNASKSATSHLGGRKRGGPGWHVGGTPAGQTPRKYPRPGFARPLDISGTAPNCQPKELSEEDSEEWRLTVQQLMDGAAEFQEMFKKQEFGQIPELLAIGFCSRNVSKPNLNSVTSEPSMMSDQATVASQKGGNAITPGIEVTLQGIFARRPAPAGGRPCYQKLRKASGKTTSSAFQVVFAPVYILWCQRSARWKITDRPSLTGPYPRRIFAMSPVDREKKCIQDVQGAWLISKSGFAGVAAADPDGSRESERVPLVVVSKPALGQLS